MEGFLTLIGIYIAYRVVMGFFRKQKINSIIAEVERERRINAFKCQIKNEFIGDNNAFEVFHVQMRGMIDGPHDNFNAKFVVKITDITQNVLPILCTLEEFQSKTSTIFWYESNLEKLPYQNSVFNNWATTIKIPKTFLIFPRSGNRIIKFNVYVVNEFDNILAETSIEETYYNKNLGYEEKSENRELFEEMIIKTGMLVGASDGNIGEDEAKIIKEWAKKRVASYTDEDYQNEVKIKLNNYIKEAYEEIENDSINIYEILEGIDHIATEGEKFELLEICLDIAKADGKADEKELKIINDIAKYIDLDQKQFRSMVEKALPITIHTSKANENDILGISPEMDKEEINKHLREEYKKWNSRVASSDPTIREQAEKMIHLIAEARKKYK